MSDDLDSDLDDEFRDEQFDEDDFGDETSPTIPCPYCKRDIYEDAEQCPHCGRYISEEDLPRRAKPWWVVLGVIACLCLVLWWMIG